MKRMLFVLICLCIMLVGCNNKTVNENTIEIDESLLSENFEFYSTEYKFTKTVTEYLSFLEDTTQSGTSFYIHEYTFFDLDFDGNNELICRLGSGEDKSFGTVIFHIIDNTIYSYDFSWRGFGSLKTDGTVDFSLSGTDYGFRTIIFGKGNSSIKSSTYVEAVFDDGEVTNSKYYVNDIISDEKEFSKEYEKHNKLDDVEFEKINIDKHTFK